MSFNLDDLFVDEDVSKEGVWVDFYSGAKLKISSTDSNTYKSKLAKLARQNRVALDDSNPAAFEVIQAITAEALASEVLLDWSGINMDGEENVAYTPARGKSALLRSSKLRDFISEKAAETALFRKEVAEKAGNS
jgi:hypothetical protein